MCNETKRQFRVFFAITSVAVVLLPSVALLSGAPKDG